MKKCTKCNEEKDNNEFYLRNKIRTNGEKYVRLDPKCKSCHKDYRIKNKEKIANINKKYIDKNKDKIAIKYKERMKRIDVKEKRREYIRKYRKKKKDNPENKIYDNCRKRLWKILRTNKKGLHTKDMIGCTPLHYKMWISYTLRNNMVWENYGKYWSIDHVIGINNFDLTKKENIQKAFNWKNTFALENYKNFSKKDKIDKKLIEEKELYLNTFLKIIEFKKNLKWAIRSQDS